MRWELLPRLLGDVAYAGDVSVRHWAILLQIHGEWGVANGEAHSRLAIRDSLHLHHDIRPPRRAEDRLLGRDRRQLPRTGARRSDVGIDMHIDQRRLA